MAHTAALNAAKGGTVPRVVTPPLGSRPARPTTNCVTSRLRSKFPHRGHDLDVFRGIVVGAACGAHVDPLQTGRSTHLAQSPPASVAARSVDNPHAMRNSTSKRTSNQTMRNGKSAPHIAKDPASVTLSLSFPRDADPNLPSTLASVPERLTITGSLPTLAPCADAWRKSCLPYRDPHPRPCASKRRQRKTARHLRTCRLNGTWACVCVCVSMFVCQRACVRWGKRFQFMSTRNLTTSCKLKGRFRRRCGGWGRGA